MFFWTNSSAFNLAMFMIPSVACCKLPPPSFWISKRWDLMLLWRRQVLFCYSLMLKKFLSLPNDSIKKNEAWSWIWTRNSCWIYILRQWETYSMGKENIRWCRWECQKKVVLNKVIFKKSQWFPTCVLFFLACPLLGVNFDRDNTNRAWTFCPLMRGVRHFCPLFTGFFIRDLY